MKRVMLDIETAGTGSHALVLSIGAVKWDDESPDTVEALLIVPDHKGQELDGRDVHLDTMKWWMQQSVEAQRVFGESYIHPSAAAAQLEIYLDDADEIWANGPDFDCIILADFMKQYNPRYRWAFWKHRCFRTMKNLFSDFLPNDAVSHRGVAHNALDDAKSQAHSLQAILGKLRNLARVN